ncbi:STAS domain-containing protein [Spiribacter halobius]|uniref:Anti-anti-sigma factor n=1 Tax=Sediminicurvatus halobius TaxID=2182432 RepID=A0A2U2N9T5_9GAMM|nr:STAS domain-containing protein [Spiribacter halobius]PWG65867.1 anti-anti-sigma factor [Spiribacter halobius]UEX77914.1 STAS domain-containing protein [Spiribacter halobius]
MADSIAHISAYRESNGCMRIRVRGRLALQNHRDFRAVYDGISDVRHYIVDLSETEYVDSAGLGMLVLLHEYAQARNATVELADANERTARILRIAGFDKIFMMTNC